jgi:phage tail sheath protein FI
LFNALISWTEVNTSRFAVLDTPADLSVAGAGTFASSLNVSSRAAVYYPHVYIKDTSISGSPLRKIGPAGAVAGLYLFNDRQAGPYKTPAGIGARVQDAIAIEKLLTNDDLDALNSSTYPLNAIRNVPGAGIVVMGGRTLKQDGTANRYIGMRRSLTYIEKSLSDLTQFAVFESNSEALWARITTTLSAFLNTYRNQGGLRGASPEDAFFVKCDSENNSSQSIADGIVNVDVGVALEYPGEFVIINLSQIVGQ